MDARRFWHAVAHRWIVIALLLVVGPLLGVVVALQLPVHYRATAAVLISADHINSIDDLGTGSQLAVNVAPSFAALVTSPAVLSPAITALGLDSSPGQLAPAVRVTVPLFSSTVDDQRHGEWPRDGRRARECGGRPVRPARAETVADD